MNNDKNPAIIWSDPMIEDAVREALNKPQGDIFPDEVSEITSLNLYGMRIWDVSSLSLMPKLKKLSINKNGRPIVWSDPAIERAVRLVLGKPEGEIGEAEVQNIIRLPILDKVIEDISSLALMPKLKVLDFEDNNLGNVDFKDLGLIYEVESGDEPKPVVIAKPDPEKMALQKAQKEETLKALNDFEKADLKAAAAPEKPLTSEERRLAFRSLMEEVSKETVNAPKHNFNHLAVDFKEPEAKPAPLAEDNLPADFEDYKITTLSPTSEKAIRASLKKGEGNIYCSDLLLLTYLKINSENLTDISFLKHTPNLQFLDLGYNQISNIKPIAELTNLTKLHIGLNEIVDLSPLSNLTQLTELELFSNRIEDLSPLSGLKNLKRLNLRNNRISNFEPLAQLTNLTWLGLDNNKMENLEFLAGLTQVQELYLNGNQLTDISILANFTNLTDLDISKNPVTDATPLSGLTQLKELCIFETKIKDRKPLRALKNTDITR